MQRGHLRKKQRNTSGLKKHHQSAPCSDENGSPIVPTDSRKVNVQRPRKQLKDGVGSEVEASSAESDDEDEEDGVSLEWGGFGEEGLGQRLADMAHDNDPNNIDWIPPQFRKKYIVKKDM